MHWIIAVLLASASFAAASEPPPAVICVGPLGNRTNYQFAIEKVKAYFVSELSHKPVRAIDITGDDIPVQMAKNKCDFLVSGEFSDYARLKPGETVQIGGVVVDGRKKFALRFTFELVKSLEGKPIYSDTIVVIDKNPKTCADDQVYEAARSILDHLKKG
jgi:hypothetical protein